MSSEIKRIDVMMPDLSQYGVMQHFTVKIYEAFLRMGFDARLLRGEDRIKIPLKDPADLMFGINGSPVNKDNVYLGDVIDRPYVSLLIDPSFRFLKLTDSDTMILACNDNYSCEILIRRNFYRTLFLPHAIEVDVPEAPLDIDRNIPVLCMASYIDAVERPKRWEGIFSKPIASLMKNAAQITLSDQKTSFIEGMLASFNQSEQSGRPVPLPVEMGRALSELELYVRALDRAALVKSVRSSEVFVTEAPNAAESREGSWRSILDGENLHINYISTVPFKDSFSLMHRSKIVLHSSPHVKQGGHERIFNSYLCGALPVAAENSFLKEYFQDGENIIFYRYNDFSGLDEKIADILNNETKRLEMVEKGKKIVLANHTWDHRMQKLIKELPSIRSS